MSKEINWLELFEKDEFIDVAEKALTQEHSSIGDLYPALKFRAKKSGFTDKDVLIFFLIICDYMGGLQIYFPRGRKIREVLLMHKIHAEFDGSNTAELARKHRLSQQTIYRYIRKVREQKKAIRNDMAQYECLIKK